MAEESNKPIGKAQSSGAVAALVEALADSSLVRQDEIEPDFFVTRHSAVEALGAEGLAAIPELLRFLEGDDLSEFALGNALSAIELASQSDTVPVEARVGRPLRHHGVMNDVERREQWLRWGDKFGDSIAAAALSGRP